MLSVGDVSVGLGPDHKAKGESVLVLSSDRPAGVVGPTENSGSDALDVAGCTSPVKDDLDWPPPEVSSSPRCVPEDYPSD